MLTPHQHEFCKGKSCLTNLLESLYESKDAVDHGSGVSVILLDLKKTFDSVPYHHAHDGKVNLVMKSVATCWNGYQNFVQRSLQRVAIVINVTCSDWISVTCNYWCSSGLDPWTTVVFVVHQQYI